MEARRLGYRPTTDMEVVVSHIRDLRIMFALGAVAVAAALPSSASAATSVCNEAGNGHLGGTNTVTGTPDPNPPARYTSELKTLANGKANGLAKAAANSPALAQCGPPTTTGGGDGGGTVTVPTYAS